MRERLYNGGQLRKPRRDRIATDETYSWRVRELTAAGQSMSAIARELGLAQKTVRRIMERNDIDRPIPGPSKRGPEGAVVILIAPLRPAQPANPNRKQTLDFEDTGEL